MPTESESSTMPKDDVAIALENVAVLYRVPREHVSGIKEYTIRWLQRRLSYEEFWAIKDISLQVNRGEVFGIIGRNGSGKSTLLKVVARVLHPTRGRVFLRGRVAPLLELGAGFHPELSGRENVFLNSAILGRTRQETEQLLPKIIDFAEIGDFIDAPLRTFSTGMTARLGFAVATCVRPDILLVDEVLSVGDAPFQQKCLDRMYSFQEQGTTILIVSHSMSVIETFCNRALWLNRGRAEALGPADEVIDHYVKMDHHEKSQSSPVETPTKAPASTAIKEFVPLPDAGQLYPVDKQLNVEQGAFTVWLKFQRKHPPCDCIIFHTDDSRYVMYVGSYFSSKLERDVRVIIARAGGNRRAFDTYFGTSSFPEVVATLDPEETPTAISFPADEWHLVTMTWDGTPDGKIQMYIDEHLVGEKAYDARFDNRHAPAQTIALGMRPREWAGELIEREDGTVVDSRPESTLPVSESDVEIGDARLYQVVLTPEDIEQIVRDKHLSTQGE